MAEFRTESNQFHVGIYWHTAQSKSGSALEIIHPRFFRSVSAI
jgi:hypothetical protein